MIDSIWLLRFSLCLFFFVLSFLYVQFYSVVTFVDIERLKKINNIQAKPSKVQFYIRLIY